MDHGFAQFLEQRNLLRGTGADAVDDLPPDALRKALSVVTCGPIKVLGDAIGSLSSSAGRLVQGGVADVCVFDPKVHWRAERDLLVSQGKFTPFAFDVTGTELPGRVRLTLVAGQVAHELG